MNKNKIKFLLDETLIEIDFSVNRLLPSTTVLNYLRLQPGFRGTKEGCAEGDCGACTIVLVELENGKLNYKSIDSCMMFLASLHGKQIITVEHLSNNQGVEQSLHPVQQAMIDQHGSQCGFCTPGVVMSLFGLYKSEQQADHQAIVDALAGNLCRCTGYSQIEAAAKTCCKQKLPDRFQENEQATVQMLTQIRNENNGIEIHHPVQTYLLPVSLEQALAFRSQFSEAIIINGATDTAIRQNKTFTFLSCILDLSAVETLKTIHREGNTFVLGSGVTVEQFKQFAKRSYAEMLPMLQVFASLQIRNVATIGGNLSTASPIGDLIPLFIAAKAEVRISGKNGHRIVPVSEYIVGYRKNCLMDDEILVSVLLPALEENVQLFVEKVSTRRDLDISTVSLAMRLQLNKLNQVEEIILAYGGMAATVKRTESVEQFLWNKTWNQQNVEKAAMLLESEFTPLSDARSGKTYRTITAKNLLLKMFWKTQNHAERISL